MITQRTLTLFIMSWIVYRDNTNNLASVNTCKSHVASARPVDKATLPLYSATKDPKCLEAITQILSSLQVNNVSFQQREYLQSLMRAQMALYASKSTFDGRSASEVFLRQMSTALGTPKPIKKRTMVHATTDGQPETIKMPQMPRFEEL